MLWKLAIPFLMVAGWTLCTPTHAFQATMRSYNGANIEFFMDFDSKDLMISASHIDCEPSNKCEFTDNQEQKGHFNRTDFSYRRAKIELYFSNGPSAIFPVFITSLKHSVMGVNPGSTWAQAFGAGLARIRLYTGEITLSNSIPPNLIPLETNAQNNRFYLPSKLISVMKRSHRPVMRTNAKVDLQFPSAIDLYNGNYFFMIHHRDLNGWDNFLKYILDEFYQYEVQYNLSFQGGSLKFDNMVFPSYDMHSFKLAPEDYPLQDFTIGRYFVAKSDMMFYMSGQQGGLKAAVEVSENGYGYGFTINPVSLIQFIVLTSLAICLIMFVIWCIPGTLKKKGEGDYVRI